MKPRDVRGFFLLFGRLPYAPGSLSLGSFAEKAKGAKPAAAVAQKSQHISVTLPY